jgi:hypothetical protein
VARAAAHRLARYEDEQRMVFGRNTYQTFAQMLGSDAAEAGYDCGSPG